MFELIAHTFSASVMAVTQLFLSAVVTTNPWFENLDIQYHAGRHEIICSSKLTDNFTETLDEVLLSGKNITLHFKYDLFTAGNSTPLQEKEVVNGLRYDAEAELFYLVNSESRKLEKFVDLEAARQRYIQVNELVVAHTRELATDAEYFFKVTAYLDPVKLDNMSESVNLMLRWASVKPTIVSGKFTLKPRST